MNSERARKLIGDIENTINEIKGFGDIGDLEKSYLAKFLVVYICGVYEEVIEGVVNEKTEKLESPQISRFVAKSLSLSFRNPNTENIKTLLKKLDESWLKKISDMPERSKIALNSIVGNKNSIAHGDSCNITLEEVLQFYKDSKPIIEEIDKIVFS